MNDAGAEGAIASDDVLASCVSLRMGFEVGSLVFLNRRRWFAFLRFGGVTCAFRNGLDAARLNRLKNSRQSSRFHDLGLPKGCIPF